MDITKTLDGTTLLVTLSGRLNTATAPTLERELGHSLNDITELIFDLARLEYISSAGLRILLQAQKAMNRQGKMTVQNVNNEVMEVFEVTGFSDFLTIENGTKDN